MVTGAPFGIGRGVVELLGDLGAQCILIARREEKLKEAASSIAGANINILCLI